MTLLILGLLLWTAAHYFKRLFPDQRAALGNPGKGMVALAIFVGVLLMVLGYRSADFIAVWTPPAFMVHLNNLLMLGAVWMFATSQSPGAKLWPATRIRHPMLISAKIWAVAHLLVNGDLAAILLFGGLLAWAVGEVILINRAEPDWTPPPVAEPARAIRVLIISAVIFAVVVAVHIWLGHWPFPA